LEKVGEFFRSEGLNDGNDDALTVKDRLDRADWGTCVYCCNLEEHPKHVKATRNKTNDEIPYHKLLSSPKVE
jgi:hypothetical protein